MPARQSTEQDAFIDIVCADEQLLRAEFMAIIDAGWDLPPPTRPSWPVRPPMRPGRSCTVQRPLLPRGHAVAMATGWIRQRAPPRMAR